MLLRVLAFSNCLNSFSLVVILTWIQDTSCPLGCWASWTAAGFSMLASTRLTALAVAQKQHELSERVITAQWIRREQGRDKRKEEGASEGGWVGVLLRERKRERERERIQMPEEGPAYTPPQLKAQGSCACVVHACIRSNGDVGALVWAGLCAECVCGQHAILVYREQRCLHEEHRRTAAEVTLSLDRTQRHTSTHTHTQIRVSPKGLPLIAAGMQRAISGMFCWGKPAVLLAWFVDMPIVGRLSCACMQLCFCQIAGPRLCCTVGTRLANRRNAQLATFPSLISHPLRFVWSLFTNWRVDTAIGKYLEIMQNNVCVCKRNSVIERDIKFIIIKLCMQITVLPYCTYCTYERS